MPEVSIEQGVDERIERRVDVTDPEQNGDDERRRFGAEFSAERVVDVPGEERKPAAEECSHNDAKCLGGFILAPHLTTFWSLTVRRSDSLYRRRLARRHAAAVAGQVETVDRRPDRHRQRLDKLGLSLGGAKDTKIGDDHDDRREPE